MVRVGLGRWCVAALVAVGVLLVADVAGADVLQVDGSPFGTGRHTVANSIAFSPNGKLFATVSQRVGVFGVKAVSVLAVNSRTGALRAVAGSPFAIGGTGVALSVSFDPSSKLLAVGEDLGVLIFRVDDRTGALRPARGSPFTISKRRDIGGAQVAFSPRGGLLAASTSVSSSYRTGEMFMFKVNRLTGALSRVRGSPFHGASGPPAFSPDGSLLATSDLSVYAVNRTTGALRPRFASPAGPVGAAAFSADGRFLAGADTGGNGVWVFAVPGMGPALVPVSGSPFSTGAYSGPLTVAYSRRGGLLATANELGDSVSLFAVDSSTGRLSEVFGSPFALETKGAQMTIPAAATFNPGGRLLAAANLVCCVSFRSAAPFDSNVSMFAVSKFGSPPRAPELGTSVDALAVRGHVRVRMKGANVGKPLRKLTRPRQLPVGSLIDARAGTVKIVAADTTGGKSSGEFRGGVFNVLQDVSGLTTLQLVEGGFPGAPNYSGCNHVGSAAAASAHARLEKKVIQLLHSNAHGAFQTRSRVTAATVRGTQWDTVLRCDATVITATRGTVVVTLERRVVKVLRVADRHPAKSVRVRR